MFYDTFLKFCEEKGVAPTRVLLDLDMSKSTITNWKEGGTPSNQTKKKLANYFGVTVSELMSGEIEKAPTEEVAANDEMAELLEEVRRSPDLKVLFSLGKNANPEELKTYINVIKAMKGRSTYE